MLNMNNLTSNNHCGNMKDWCSKCPPYRNAARQHCPQKKIKK